MQERWPPSVCTKAMDCDFVGGCSFAATPFILGVQDFQIPSFAFMAETPTVAEAENSSTIPSSPSPSSSSSSALPVNHDDHLLAKALQTLFLNVTTVVQGELQAANSEYELLERMNLRVASEHDHQAEFAQGLRVFVERLKQKNDALGECVQQIEEIDHEVTELEALVSTLDNYTTNLESKLRIACAQARSRHTPLL